MKRKFEASGAAAFVLVVVSWRFRPACPAPVRDCMICSLSLPDSVLAQGVGFCLVGVCSLHSFVA